ncbi:MAG: oligoendopeptidase F, partial [Parcubacteria bacterium C7867-006]
DEVANAALTRLDNRLTALSNRLVFFDVLLSKIPTNKQKAFLKDKTLKHYHYFLKKTFDSAKYVLSEKEEQMTSLLSQTSYSMWVDGQEKLLSSQVVDFKGEKMPIQKAISLVSELPKEDRDVLSKKISEVLKSVSHFAEAEINAVYNFKKVMDERRGFKNPYSSTVLSYENNEKSVMLLVDLITKNFKIAHRFYRLHAKLLKQKKLSVSDRGVKIGEIKKKFDFDTSVSIVGDIFSKVGGQYREIFDKLLSNGQVDVYPKKGKSGGAYCASGYDTPTFVLLNHVDELRSLETLAHEMGHAIHSELSKRQPMIYQSYSTSTAEVASTFFEQVVMDKIEDHLSKDEKIVLLHNRIMGDIATIFRQIACFNFELELHQRIRVEGQLPKNEIAKLLQKHLASYLGDAFDVTEDDGYYFVNWSHIRRFFYVYSYAYGQLVSRALFENWKKDNSYADKIEQFLSMGGSMSPEDIFKKVGINVNNPEFFESGLKSIEKDIEKLEKLTK